MLIKNPILDYASFFCERVFHPDLPQGSICIIEKNSTKPYCDEKETGPNFSNSKLLLVIMVVVVVCNIASGYLFCRQINRDEQILADWLIGNVFFLPNLDNNIKWENGLSLLKG